MHFTLQADGTVRSDLDFTKKTEDGRTLSNIPFTITSPTGEVHTVVTDENGYYSTAGSYISHGVNTNGGVAGVCLRFRRLMIFVTHTVAI